MLCLNDSIRHDDPSVQCLVSAVEDAVTLTALLVAAWQSARVLVIHIGRSRAGRTCLSPDAVACLPRVWTVCAEQGLRSASGHQPVWAAAVAQAGRTVPPGVRRRAGGALR
jgi:hypothetical protein